MPQTDTLIAPGRSTPNQIDRRFMRVVAAVSIVASAGALALEGPRTGAAFALGALVGWVNLRWLYAGVTTYLQRRLPEGTLGPPVRFGMTRLALRYVLVGTAICGMFISHLLPVEAFLAGLLAAPVGMTLAVVIESCLALREERKAG